MNKLPMKFLYALLLLLLGQPLLAQNKFLTGLIVDSIDNKSVEHTAVVLYSIKDSSLAAFTRAKPGGRFTMKKPPNGIYLLSAFHPAYGGYLDTVSVTESLETLLPVKLLPKRIIYEQVLIKASIAPIRIKGDTIVYTADSFKVRDGANVEELLRKLPGIQVGKNGEIVAMGEKVKKVLVDGEEFFGDDPGIAIKNLRADAVDQVEVFDKKSDQAAFTGIDDGVKDKTINLKLKDNKKNGYFGKVSASGGTPDNYSNQAMINVFQKSRKIAAFGIMSNVGSVNLGWNDREKFGDDDGMESGVTEGGGMWSSNSTDEFNNFYGGANGIPKNWNGGLHYSNKFNNDKQTVNLGYKYNKVNANANSRSYSNTFLPDTGWSNNSGSHVFTSRIRNAFNTAFSTQLDSMNQIKFNFKGNQQLDNSASNYTSETFSANPINKNERSNTNNNRKKTMDGALLFMHKFAKKGRTISVNLGTANLESNSSGLLYSVSRFYKSGNLFSTDTTDQNKISHNRNNNWNGRVAITEPVNKLVLAELSYAYGYNENETDRNAFDKDPTGKYSVLSSAFSNHYNFKTRVQTPGLSFKYTKKKFNASLGSKLGFNRFEQTNVTNGFRQLYRFTNIFPSAAANLKMKGNKGLNLAYQGSGTAPGLNMLQPVQDNSNPFNIITGNPDLKQSFNHEFNGYFNMWNVLTERSIWSYFNFNTVKNAYTNYSKIDSLGRTVSKYVNVNGNFNLNAAFNFGFKPKKTGTHIDMGPQINFNNSNDFVNGFNNNSKILSYGLRMQLNKWSDGKWGFWMGHNFNRNISKSTISNRSNIRYWSIDGNSSFWWPITKKYNFSSDIDYEIRQKDNRYPRNNNYMSLNASLSKKIGKDAFLIQFEVKDILNQNRGYQRNFSSYNFTESFYNTLRRYWLCTITYNLNSQKSK